MLCGAKPPLPLARALPWKCVLMRLRLPPHLHVRQRPTVPAPPRHMQLLEGSGVPAYAAQSAALNASLAALPDPLLDVRDAAVIQLQALQYYQAATTWLLGNTTSNTTAG